MLDKIELSIMRALAIGFPDDAIMQELCISKKRLIKGFNDIFNKLNAVDNVDLMLWSMNNLQVISLSNFGAYDIVLETLKVHKKKMGI